MSVTTRKPRPGEKDGRDYRFASREEFENLKDSGYFAEWAVVHGELYGTPKSEINRIIGSGKDLMLELDVQGGKAIKQTYPGAVMIFLEVAEEEEYRRRILSREMGLSADELEEEIRKRMESKRNELKAVHEYEHIIFNDDLEKTVKEIHAIIDKEKSRVTPAEGDE